MKNKLASYIKSITDKVRGAASFIGLVKMIKPSSGFDPKNIPAKPDYNDLDAWAAHPKIKSKAHWKPHGIQETEVEKEVDVFFIHPTTYFGKKNWNADISSPVPNEMLNELVLPGQVSVFNQSCRIYCPKYRQATFYSFWEGGVNARQALAVAYEDVEKAFRHYIANENNGRPFIIASHSQGTIHAMRLLEAEIDQSALYKQFVCAYLPGFEFPIDKFDRSFNRITASKQGEDIGSIIAWDSYLEGSKVYKQLDTAEHWYRNTDGEWIWEKRVKKMNLCINPLSWTQDKLLIDKSDHLGGVALDLKNQRIQFNDMVSEEVGRFQSNAITRPYLELCSAQCAPNSLLYISKPKPLLFRMVLLPGGNYHNYDYSLFYMNIRKNVADRIQSYFRKIETNE